MAGGTKSDSKPLLLQVYEIVTLRRMLEDERLFLQL